MNKMMKLWLTTSFLMISASVTGQEQQSDEQQLRHLKLSLWPQAYQQQDTQLLSEILHDGFQMIDNSGQTSNKADELEYIKKNSWTAKNFSYEIYRLDIFNGSTAIISGRGETDSYTYHSSNVLIKTDDRWQAIASHVSGYTKK